MSFSLLLLFCARNNSNTGITSHNETNAIPEVKAIFHFTKTMTATAQALEIMTMSKHIC